MNKLKLSVTIKSKEKTLFEGTVTSVTSKNDKGVFDILPFHTNFITLIKDFVIFNKDQEDEERFDMKKGVLYIINNEVNVYVGI